MTTELNPEILSDGRYEFRLQDPFTGRVEALVQVTADGIFVRRPGAHEDDCIIIEVHDRDGDPELRLYESQTGNHPVGLGTGIVYLPVTVTR